MSKFYGVNENQLPSGGDLGDLAYQNTEEVRVKKLTAQEISEGEWPSSSPSFYVNFAQSGVIDPRFRSYRSSWGTCRDRSGIIKHVPPYEPRLDYNPETGECLGLLTEEARVNNFINNFPITGIYSWATSYLNVENHTDETTAPDGSNTATRLIPDTTNTSGQYFAQNFVNMTERKFHTVSCFIKPRQMWYDEASSSYSTATPARYIGLRLDNNSGWTAFDLLTGTVVFENPETTNDGLESTYSGIEKYPNGWYRIWATFQNNLTGDNPEFYILHPTIAPTASTVFNAYAGDNTNYGVYVWGFQCERTYGLENYGVDSDTNYGQYPRPTSYFPHYFTGTYGSAVTRYNDFSIIRWEDIIEFTHNKYEMTAFITYRVFDRSTVSIYSRPMQDSGAAIQMMIKGSLNSDIRHRAYAPNGSGGSASITDYPHQNAPDLYNLDQDVKIAISMKSGQTIAAVNGEIISRSFEQWTQIYDLGEGLFLGDQGGGRPLNGHIREVAFYNTALSASEIKGLTGV
jgi:hypothetical protein